MMSSNEEVVSITLDTKEIDKKISQVKDLQQKAIKDNTKSIVTPLNNLDKNLSNVLKDLKQSIIKQTNETKALSNHLKELTKSTQSLLTKIGRQKIGGNLTTPPKPKELLEKQDKPTPPLTPSQKQVEQQFFKHLEDATQSLEQHKKLKNETDGLTEQKGIIESLKKEAHELNKSKESLDKAKIYQQQLKSEKAPKEHLENIKKKISQVESAHKLNMIDFKPRKQDHDKRVKDEIRLQKLQEKILKDEQKLLSKKQDTLNAQHTNNKFIKHGFRGLITKLTMIATGLAGVVKAINFITAPFTNYSNRKNDALTLNQIAGETNSKVTDVMKIRTISKSLNSPEIENVGLGVKRIMGTNIQAGQSLSALLHLDRKELLNMSPIQVAIKFLDNFKKYIANDERSLQIFQNMLDAISNDPTAQMLSATTLMGLIGGAKGTGIDVTPEIKRQAQALDKKDLEPQNQKVLKDMPKIKKGLLDASLSESKRDYQSKMYDYASTRFANNTMDAWYKIGDKFYQVTTKLANALDTLEHTVDLLTSFNTTHPSQGVLTSHKSLDYHYFMKNTPPSVNKNTTQGAPR